MFLAVGLSSGLSSVRVKRDSVYQVDKPWICSGVVDLDSVTVIINARDGGLSNQGSSGNDAVLLRAGCTGRIGQLTIVQYRGDAIKVSDGVHDLVVEGGSIRCYARDTGDHQDGVQAMGGERVTFFNLDDQCLSANNAAFFVNRGTNSPNKPTDIVCDGCFLSGGGMTVRIYDSVRSGVRNSRIVTGKVRALSTTPLAVDPVVAGNAVLPLRPQNGADASGGQQPQTPSLGARPRVSLSGTTTDPLRVQRRGAVGVVSTGVMVDRPALLLVSVVASKAAAGGPLPLLKESAVAGARSGRQHTEIVGRATVGRETSILVRLSLRSLHPGTNYKLRVTAQEPASGRASTVSVPFQL